MLELRTNRWTIIRNFVFIFILIISVLLAGCIHDNQTNINNTSISENLDDSSLNETELTSKEVRDILRGFTYADLSGEYELRTIVYHQDILHSLSGSGARVVFRSDSEIAGGTYEHGIDTQNVTDTETVNVGMSLVGENLSVKYGELGSSGREYVIENVTLEDRGRVFRVNMTNRTEWKYDSFAPKLLELLDSEVEKGRPRGWRLYPDKSEVADYINSQFVMLTGEERVNLSADDIEDYNVRIDRLEYKSGAKRPDNDTEVHLSRLVVGGHLRDGGEIEHTLQKPIDITDTE